MKHLLIAGPTASGKSAYALKAAKDGGIIVNTDASQIYAGWRVLTARPDAAEEASAPHRLYGYVDAADRYSVGDWLRDVAALMQEVGGERLIFVGGTGLYFKALTEGLVDIPQPSEAVRAAVAARLGEGGRGGLAAELQARDPDTAARTDLLNQMRVSRALEVLDETGRGLADWQADTPPPLVADTDRCLITLDRDVLYARCDARFDAMMQGGALDEARAMLARNLDAALPAMKAVGAPELFSHLRGEITFGEAALAAKQSTRNYAKRQMTWMRNQMRDWRQVSP